MLHQPRLALAVIAAGALLAGCGPRAKPTTYQLDIEPYEVEVAVPANVTFSGTVTVDGEQKAIGPFTTPWHGEWTAMRFGAELRTTDVNGMRATLTFEEPPVPPLTVRNRAKGPHGTLIRIVETRYASSQGVHIQAMLLPGPAGAATAASEAVPAAAPAASGPATRG